jgi:hypothetical protein
MLDDKNLEDKMNMSKFELQTSVRKVQKREQSAKNGGGSKDYTIAM